MNHANGLEGVPQDQRRSGVPNLSTGSNSVPSLSGDRRRFPGQTPVLNPVLDPDQTLEKTLGYEAAAAIAADPAKLSLTGMLIARATQGSDVRFEKVAALRQAIAAGTYRIPSEDVAAKLIDDLKM